MIARLSRMRVDSKGLPSFFERTKKMQRETSAFLSLVVLLGGITLTTLTIKFYKGNISVIDYIIILSLILSSIIYIAASIRYNKGDKNK